MLQQQRHNRFLGQLTGQWLLKGLLLGALISIAGVLLASTDLGRWLEEDISLSWLFKLRGPLPSPQNVVVVSINHLSSQQLNIDNNPRKWPRSLHAELVNKLTLQGAAVIAFDILFEETREPKDNQLFANSMKQSGKTILFQSLNRAPIVNTQTEASTAPIAFIESLISPTPVLRDAALGLAPFSLPKVPAQVNHFITFNADLEHVPSLPVLALQVYALPHYSLLYDLLNTVIPEKISHLPARIEAAGYHPLSVNGGIQNLSRSLRLLFINNPQLAKQLHTQLDASSSALTLDQRNILTSLINSYKQPNSLYLNFYGPSHSIKTIPYYKVLESSTPGNSLDLNGKAVFVGFSEQFQPLQKDGFYTVFSQQNSGLDVSGVEIAATAFANLLHQQSIRASNATTDILIYFSWACLLSIIVCPLRGSVIFPVVILAGACYLGLAYALFKTSQLWIPLGIPLFWQAPLCLLGSLLMKYLSEQLQRKKIHQVFSQHIPVDIVDQLSRGTTDIQHNSDYAQGIVMATDAQQYTHLSEQLKADELHQLMNRYYATLFAPVRNSGGIISDVVGDAAMAIWASTDADKQHRQLACEAALNIMSGVDHFNQQAENHALPTRMGLHFGELVLGHVGAIDHYEYRAIGDTVNTASRIEGLNKQLGTSILVSKEVINGLDEFVTRKLGNFLLQGKTQPLSLYELLGKKDELKSIKPFEDFYRAIKSFQTEQWDKAAHIFENYIATFGDDGPSQYYLKLCKQHIEKPPKNWNGLIVVKNK